METAKGRETTRNRLSERQTKPAGQGYEGGGGGG